MRDHLRIREQPARRTDAHPPRRGVDDRRADERGDQRQEHQRPRDLQDRQREQIERDVVAEDRIRLIERRRVTVEQPLLPVRAGVGAQREAAERGDDEHERSQLAGLDDEHARAFGRGHDDLAARHGAEGDQEVGENQAGREDEDDGGEAGLRRDRAREDVLIAQLAEPEPVGVELDQRGQAHEDEGQDQQEGNAGATQQPCPVIVVPTGRVCDGVAQAPRTQRIIASGAASP